MKFVLMFWVAVVLCLSVVEAADSIEDLAQQAEMAYIKRDFKVAAKFYQQMIDQGVKSSEVYFDLGNSYYQLHDLGRALVNYRRAELITPRDEQLRLNLARIRVQRVDGTIVEDGIAGQMVSVTSEWVSVGELGWLIVILCWFCCGLIAVYLWRGNWRKRVRWAILASVVLLMFIGVLAITRIVVDTSRKPAVLINDFVSVMSGPGANYLTIFELHAAAEIRIVEALNGWVRFQLPDLREGWIDEQSIEVI